MNAIVGSAGSATARVRSMAVLGGAALALSVGWGLHAESAEAHTVLSCDGRQPTVISIPGVRSVGTPGADVVVGFPLLRDTLDGRGGNDVLCGLGNKDTLFGGTGADKPLGNNGADRLRGGPGPDLLRGGRGFDRCFGGPGQDRAVGCELVRSAS